MAEIPIERKERRNLLLPLLLGLLLLLLLGYCFLRPKGTTTAVTDTTGGAAATTAATPVGADTARGAVAAGTGAPGTSAGEIDQFTRFVQQHDTTKETEGQHQYTAEGTRRLAAALDAVSGGTPNISAYADSMRRSIDRLQQSSPNDVHADDAKAAFSAAVSAMATIDKARGRTRDVAPMRAIYGELDPKRPLLPQLATVDRFFKAAADALQQMR